MINKRNLLALSAAGAVACVARPARASCVGPRLDRAAYDRYVALFNAADDRFADFYDDGVDFLTFMKGKRAVLAFYATQRPFIKESLRVAFFCSDGSGAAAEVFGEFRCIRDINAPEMYKMYGRPIKAGEVRRMHGYLFYELDERGKIAKIKGPAPEVVNEWRMEPA